MSHLTLTKPGGVRQTGGTYLKITDEAITEAQLEMTRRTGLYAEPACAAGWAGALEALSQGHIQANENVVIVSTGHGLKDLNGANRGRVLS